MRGFSHKKKSTASRTTSSSIENEFEIGYFGSSGVMCSSASSAERRLAQQRVHHFRHTEDVLFAHESPDEKFRTDIVA